MNPENSKPSLTSHILNIQTGKPAEGVAVRCYRSGENEPMGSAITDSDGRVTKWDKPFTLTYDASSNQVYRIEFDVGEWFISRGEKSLYPKVSIEFSVEDEAHYHIPLLLSAYGYSTYRGS